MRILTVRQPWANAIIHGGKDVENRVRNIAGSYRGPVAIHAGQAVDDDAPKQLWGDFHDSEHEAFGAIIGVIDLVDVHRECCDTDDYPICSEWAEFGQWHLELANPRPLSEPIPYKGALGLRELPYAVVAQINNALETP